MSNELNPVKKAWVSTQAFYCRDQTIEVAYDNAPFVRYIDRGWRPVVPLYLRKALETHYVSLTISPGNTITWYPDGLIIKKTRTAIVKFLPVPTFASAIRQDPYVHGPTSFKFNSDGSVLVKAFGEEYFFGPPFEVIPEEGVELPDGHCCRYSNDHWAYGYEDCWCTPSQTDSSY
jgi:hypothetical protein